MARIQGSKTGWRHQFRITSHDLPSSASDSSELRGSAAAYTKYAQGLVLIGLIRAGKPCGAGQIVADSEPPAAIA
jgi:hypothetical protein